MDVEKENAPTAKGLDILVPFVPMEKWKRLAGLIVTVVLAKGIGILTENVGGVVTAMDVAR